MTYPEAIEYLYSLRWFGAKLGLENTLRLAHVAGDPHKRLRFIHLAGTNGKGSTCAMLESIYRHAGYKTGLYTSPHLVEFGERIQVNRSLIPQQDIVRLCLKMKELISTLPGDEHPTFFEVVTVMAITWFAEQGCDIVIWETGLGGRLDATNIVTPLASAITNIQYDHQKWLGSTLSSIATEKAGIIKSGVPSFTAATEPEALQVIREVAARNQSPLVEVSEADYSLPPLNTIPLGLKGRHQRANAALAHAIVSALQKQLPVSDSAIRQGLSSLQWPGRLQLVRFADGRQILIDGAHNIAGMHALETALRDLFPGKKTVLILGILADKDWADMCRILAPLATKIIVVPVHSDRTALPRDLLSVCVQANPDACVVEAETLEGALASVTGEELVLITGSLYLVGEAMELLHVYMPRADSERALNEWGNAGSPSTPPQIP